MTESEFFMITSLHPDSFLCSKISFRNSIENKTGLPRCLLNTGTTKGIGAYASKDIKKGFVTHSSGNHAQAVALSSKIMKTNAYIVMPKSAPKIKINAVKGYGADITFCENNENARTRSCQKLIQKTGANFIHPYDNNRVIAGQATCSKEIYDISPKLNLDYILCPVGGGGLASGTILSTNFFSPKTNWVTRTALCFT